MAKPELQYAVHGVLDSEGVAHSFVPGDDVPEWAQRVITNPKAWAVAPVFEDEKPPPRSPRKK